MSKNYELDSLKSQEQSAFQRKQAAWNRYQEAKNRAQSAYNVMQSAWQERCSTREAMNREYEALQRNSSHYSTVWDEYGRIRDANNARIESLRRDADSEHQEMVRCFERASYAYSSGDKASAPTYAQEGHQHQARRDQLNAEISSLCNEVKSARQNAEWRAPKTNSSAFHRAKDVFQSAKSRHESAQAEFKRLKAERDQRKNEFDALHAKHTQLKAEFQRKLEAVKAQKKQTRQKMVDKVNMALVKTKPFYLGSIFGKNAKIVPRNDGKTDVYFAGMAAAGDGLGHGHAVIDQYGNVTYLRDAWVSDRKNDYLIDDRADKYGKNTHKI